MGDVAAKLRYWDEIGRGADRELVRVALEAKNIEARPVLI